MNLYDHIYVGESFQDYSWIQDFDADFPQKVSLKMLNQEDYINSFSDLFSVCQKTIQHLNWKLWIFSGRKFRILEILNFHPCTCIFGITVIWLQVHCLFIILRVT